MTSAFDAMLSDDDEEREAAIEKTSKLGEAERAKLLPPLLKELAKRLKGAKDDTNEVEHPAAALMALQMPEAEAAVLAVAEHKNAQVRACLPEIVARHPSEATRAVVRKLAVDKNEDVRDAAFEELKEHPDAGAAEALLKQATKKQSTSGTVLEALVACARLAPAPVRAEVEAFFVKRFDAEDEDEALAALESVGGLGTVSTATLAALRERTSARDERQRVRAVAALAALGDDTEARLAALIELAARGTAMESATAGTLLHDLPRAPVAKALRAALSHPLAVVRAEAVEECTAIPGLAEHADVDAVEAMLADADEEVRLAAIRALGGLTDHRKRVTPRLEALAKGEMKAARDAARSALQRLAWAASNDDDGEGDEEEEGHEATEDVKGADDSASRNPVPPAAREGDPLFIARTHTRPLAVTEKDRNTGSRLGGPPPEGLQPSRCPRCDQPRLYVATFEEDVLGAEVAGGKAVSVLACSGACPLKARGPGAGFSAVVHPPASRGAPVDWQWTLLGCGFTAGKPKRDVDTENNDGGPIMGSKVGGRPFFVDLPLEAAATAAFILQFPDSDTPGGDDVVMLLGGGSQIFLFGTEREGKVTLDGAIVEVEPG
jgi:hypothetical protein